MRFCLILFSSLLFLCSSVQHSLGQRIARSQQVIDTLCSPYFGGRGYAHDGHNRAAGYIANAYRELGLKPVYPDYYHKFKLKVNLFPGEMSVIGSNQLITGRDFVVSPTSGSCSGEFDVWMPEYGTLKLSRLAKMLKKKSRKKQVALALDSGWLRASSEEMKKLRGSLSKLKQVCLVQFRKDLTWATARNQDSYATIWVGPTGWEKIQKSMKIEVEAELKVVESQNVVGMIKGTEQPDSFIWFTAHYDHLGYMGRTVYIPGANDNASGVAMMLEMARHYSENPPRYSMIFVGFSGEEAGLVGSYHLAQSPPDLCPLSQIKFLINIDLMGSGEDGVMAVNGSVFKESWSALDSINKANNYLKIVKRRGKAANSDHYFFVEQGVSGFFFYLMGEFNFYHEVDDNAKELKLSEHYEKAFYLFRDFVNHLTGSS